MRISNDAQVTRGVSARLSPWKVRSSLLGGCRCRGICQQPYNMQTQCRTVDLVCHTIQQCMTLGDMSATAGKGFSAWQQQVYRNLPCCGCEDAMCFTYSRVTSACKWICPYLEHSCGVGLYHVGSSDIAIRYLHRFWDPFALFTHSEHVEPPALHASYAGFISNSPFHG